MKSFILELLLFYSLCFKVTTRAVKGLQIGKSFSGAQIKFLFTVLI